MRKTADRYHEYERGSERELVPILSEKSSSFSMGAGRERLMWLVVLLLFVLNTLGLYLAFTSKGNYALWDFHPIWVGAGAVLQGEDPYSSEVVRRINEHLRGPQSAQQQQTEDAFWYPLYVAYLALPLAGLPLPWAEAVYLSGLEMALLSGIGLAIALWRWPQSTFGRLGIAMWAASLYPVVWVFILGQASGWVAFLIIFSLWALSRQRDLPAGVALGLGLIKPQLIGLLIPLLILWGWFHRRRKFVLATVITVSTLVGVPTLLDADWMSRFGRMLVEYNSRHRFDPPLALLVDRVAPSGVTWVTQVIALVLIIWCGFGWWRAFRSSRLRDLFLVVGLTLILTTALLPQMTVVNQAVLLFPLLGAFRWLSEQKRGTNVFLVGALLLMGIGYWMLYTRLPEIEMSGRYLLEHRVFAPILPLTLVALWIPMSWLWFRASPHAAQEM